LTQSMATVPYKNKGREGVGEPMRFPTRLN
jgi:hypothetical protein